MGETNRHTFSGRGITDVVSTLTGDTFCGIAGITDLFGLGRLLATGGHFVFAWVVIELTNLTSPTIVVRVTETTEADSPFVLQLDLITTVGGRTIL